MGRTFACSDLHGMMNLYKQIKEFIEPEDTVICLGDCGDRGYDSWELIKKVYTDPQFIYLMGNHERMLIDAGAEFLQTDDYGMKFSLLWQNGGENTFEGWMANEMNEDWLAHLRRLPVSYKYINKDGIHIYLTHAGFTPLYDEYDEIVLPDSYDLVWDRYHFDDPWPIDADPILIVHGHTPIPSLMRRLGEASNEWEPGAYWYCKNHKVCIDNGAFHTGYCCLLDLDTFDEHIFYDAEVETGW